MHVCCFSPAFPSHVSALSAVATELARRGHRVTLVHRADVGTFAAGDLGFHAVGLKTHPPGSLLPALRRASRAGVPFGLSGVIRDMADGTDLLCREGPAALAALGADAVIADEMEAAGGLVAASMDLPFVSLASALPVEPDPDLPLPVLPFGYDPSEKGRRRNRIGAAVHDALMRPHRKVVADWAAAFRLSPRLGLEDCLSPLATVSQTVEAFDLPRARPAPRLHHLGPFRSGPPVDPVPAAAGEGPRVYASLGTLQGWRLGLFRRIAAGCRRIGARLTVAHCGALSDEDAGRIGADRVAGFLDQRRAIAEADVVVTHGGLNTVMDAVAAGVPVLVLPIAFDQPGVAARVAHHGLGLVLDRRLAGAGRIARALDALVSDAGYRMRALAMSGHVRRAGGAAAAADVIEDAFDLDWPQPLREAAR